jgi:signal transduction histidine kinase
MDAGKPDFDIKFAELREELENNRRQLRTISYNAKLSSGSKRLNLQHVNFGEIVGNPGIKFLEETAIRQGLTFSVIVDTDMPDMIADQELISQALLNLVENAVSFTESGGIEVSITKSKYRFVKVSVKDTGVGVYKKEKYLIFKKYQQGSRKSSKKHMGLGLGLGLSITKQIVGLHKGHLGVESEEGKGSVFWFIIVSQNLSG